MTEFIQQFQEFRKILCVCSCCGNLSKVSDLHLKYKGKVARTWLDYYEKDSTLLNSKVELFEEKAGKLREKAVEKGRKEAQKVFNQAITPAFKTLKLDPFDVKPILNPIDFVVFKGMNQSGTISDIVFLSKQTVHKTINTLREQVKVAILKKKYEWQVARINERGNISFE